ncbi:hypothetical protein BC826DRAFT_974216 [Russula brevipes]|nr:hypothetical protein BC826DRAFT_974216 [Russula brevipes]
MADMSGLCACCWTMERMETCGTVIASGLYSIMRRTTDIGNGFADQTPLHLAVIKGQTKVAQLLIQHGADANAKCEISFTPFQAATMYARHNIVQLMLEGGAEREEGL